jgi:5-methylcytosine-specific restriction endonuclease McrA
MALMGQTSAWKAPPGWRARIRPAVFARYGRACWRCGGYATTVGHVVARVLGGGHDLENLRPECAPCNYGAGAALGNRLRAPRGCAPRGWRTSRNW